MKIIFFAWWIRAIVGGPTDHGIFFSFFFLFFLFITCQTILWGNLVSWMTSLKTNLPPRKKDVILLHFFIMVSCFFRSFLFFYPWSLVFLQDKGQSLFSHSAIPNASELHPLFFFFFFFSGRNFMVFDKEIGKIWGKQNFWCKPGLFSTIFTRRGLTI